MESGQTETDFRCETCDRYFEKQRYLTRHVDRVHLGCKSAEKEYRCGDCGMTYRSREYLNAHRNKVHGSAPALACDLCSKVFNYYTSLRKHKLFHEKGEEKYPCLKCDEVFCAMETLNHHVKEEHDSLWRDGLQCDVCGAIFYTKSGLRSHKKDQHEEEKEDGLAYLRCKTCGVAFDTKEDLDSHLVAML